MPTAYSPDGPYARMARVVALLLVKPRTIPELERLEGAPCLAAMRNITAALRAEGLVEKIATAGGGQFGRGRAPSVWRWVGSNQKEQAKC